MLTMFHDRVEAATRLLPRLAHVQDDDITVLAIPRGGVVIGSVIAQQKHCPLGVVLTKKIGHPADAEYAIGAVSLDAVQIDPGHDDVPAAYIEQETLRLRALLRARQAAIAKAHVTPAIAGRTVIIVDDGIATGLTIRVAIMTVRAQHPRRIIVAAPVAAPSIPKELRPLADEIVILSTPRDFMGVGQFYRHFDQVEDDEVERLLRAG
ncbi:MAG: phosphoribosyltransferase [Candidatus Kapabacteria bacterium]|nr:phosphoribosyltransferase [Candidatus Kapabacteria bacterium]